ncbi:MAG: malonyl-ACP O-methyltransferase BioC [Bacteroidales bacterium]|nr:malonyl-ACP O-methyltransferase BioC [Bacteroidales bacterium]
MEQLGRNYQMSNKELLQKRFGKALNTYNDHAVVQFHIHDKLLSFLSKGEKKHFNRSIEIGCGSGELTKRILHSFSIEEVYLNDICKKWENVLERNMKGSFKKFYHCDGEDFPFEMEFDLITSASAMQWFHNPKFFIEKCASHIPRGGVLLLSTFGPENFREIKHITGKGLLYPSISQLQEWLSPYFKIHILKDELYPLYFSSSLEVLKHMKNTGVTGTGTSHWSKKEFSDFCLRYEHLFLHTEKGVSLTYHPIYIYATKY